MFTIWPYLIRLAISFYFIYPHAQSLLNGISKFEKAIFSCVNDYVPMTIAFTLWHAFFVLLGMLILVWPQPILPLMVALVILTTQLYINFATYSYTVTNMLLFVLVLITLALIIYHSRPQFR
jgi:hypothetical protein